MYLMLNIFKVCEGLPNINLACGPVCLWYVPNYDVSLLVICAAHSYSQTDSQQSTSTHHSPFHPSCPHSRCHGHRPNGQECSANYHNETHSLCMHVELRKNMKKETVLLRQMQKYQAQIKLVKGFLDAVFSFCQYYDLKHPDFIKQFVQLLKLQ